MKEGPDITRIAALIGDPARANMLNALMSGRALTAKELAAEANITAQTASSHLGKLLDGGLAIVRQEGRHRYFAIADPQVADILERMSGLAASKGHLRHSTGPRDPAMRDCRTCYDHLAGESAVRLYDAMAVAKWFTGRPERPGLAKHALESLSLFGIDSDPLFRAKRPVCRPCLDWSERRYHLAGSLGAELLKTFLYRNWVKRHAHSRTISFTPKGDKEFAAILAFIQRQA